mgnify:CR=1 FL=1
MVLAVLGEELAAHGWSPRDLAEILGRPLELVDQIVSGKGKISQEMSKILGDAFRYTPSLSFKLDTLLADVASKIPPEIDDTTYNPQLIAWLKAKKIKDRIFRVALHRGEYKIDYIKFLLNWFNDLRSNPRTDEGYQNKGAYREVSMGRANIVIIDPAGDKDYDAQFVKAASRLHHQLQRSKLDAVWYGPLFYMGTKNPELTGELLTLAKNMGYDISSYAGRYNPGTDLVLTSGYAEDAAKTLAHELGHRYWYKFMDKEHRGRFQDLVRTRPPTIENTSEAQKKYLDEMDYLPGERDEDGDEKPILPVSSYGGTNVAEAFAEVFSYYVTGQSMSQDQRVSFRWMAGLRYSNLICRVAERHVFAGMFDYPGNLFDEVASWIEGLDLNPGGNGWKRHTKKFPLTEKSLGEWRYLDRVRELVGDVDRFIKKFYPLKVSVVFDVGGKKGKGDWSPVGNTMNLYSRYQGLPDTIWSTLEHELRHFAQYLFEEALNSKGMGGKPGLPPHKILNDGVKQNSRLKGIEKIRTHDLDDDEFYPMLGSELVRWSELVEDERYPMLTWVQKREAFGSYVGAIKRPDLPDWTLQWLSNNAHMNQFRSLLSNPGKWKKAVKLFSSLIAD